MYKAISLPIVLYGCETWSDTIKKEHTCRLKIFEKKVMGRIMELRDINK